MRFAAVQWTVENDAQPLRYAFGEIVEGDCEPWGPPSDIPEFKGIMPSGSGSDNILTLCVIVVDKYESFALAKKNIISNPVALNADALDILFSNTVEDQIRSGNLDQALSSMRNIGETAKDSNDTSGRKISVRYLATVETIYVCYNVAKKRLQLRRRRLTAKFTRTNEKKG